MKWQQTILFFSLIYCNTLIVSAQNITVDDTYTAQQLVENVLVNSSCATVYNVAAKGDTFPVGENSHGYFTNAGGSFPFAEGVVLSTQYAKKSIGPYNWVLGNDNDGGWLGDADLNQILGINSVTATVLEFDFIPLTNFLSFDYIFASTEYADTGSCRFTDGFAFLIKENTLGSVYENLAVIPGTQTPVSSTNIHPTILPSGIYNGCAAVNENYFNGFNTASSPINFAGQTAIMNTQTPVIAGKSYHIKLVIANDFNEYYDSAVFFKAGSFSPKFDLGSDRLATSNPICFGESYTIDTQLPATYDYKWYKDGVLLPTEKSPILTISDNGTYKVEVVFTPATCLAIDEIKLEYAPEIIVSNTTLAQCDDNADGISIFNLTRVDNIIKNNDTTLSPVVYYESLADAQGKLNPILTPTTYTNKLTVPTLFARVTNIFGCANYAQLNLKIANNLISPQSPVSNCDDDGVQDGFYQFDLNTQITPQVLNGLPSGMIVEYYLSTTDAIAQKNSLTNIFKNTTPNQQIIQARIVNGPDCFGIVPVRLVVNTFNPVNFQEEMGFVCVDSTTDLSVASGFSSYLWNTGATSNSIPINVAGNYSVTVTNAEGCKAVKKFNLTSSEIATITGATVTDFAGNNNSVLLQYTGIGDNYEFSIDGSYFQDNPLFTGIAPGKYLAYANDKNACGLSIPFTIYVLDYPRFFTPNGDGYNDIWKIKNLDLFPNSTLTIYNRYGKILTEINTVNPYWTGKYNGKELPSDDYWFQLNLGEGKIIKGHFTLKR
ncbi:T9SS type B sorting domain-containing protein [Flavobacterium franklandianum]|uniref:T9SS type B sorting domain-containing protein n=1 Tax=Flavobacterium franklandianum TaxID=2594430 RepID=UPI00117B718C|nr:choice-of-anchor L domain-containing protein [Flavobacterium franklandianum]TRX21455.1 T9SS type B sorting domain-containing protein [Flavobacterium franklandianum]